MGKSKSKSKRKDATLPRKFLVVVDHTDECGTAVRYAAKRAAHTGGKLAMICVISPTEFQHWLGVGNIMREEAEAEAQEMLAARKVEANEYAGVEAESIVREGETAVEIINLIEEDEEIAILVLASSCGKTGPGPLVSMLTSQAGCDFPIPVTIVPDHLSDEEMNALA